MNRPLVAVLDDESVLHVREAMRRYVQWTERMGQRLPDGVRDFHRGLQINDRRRQAPPLVDMPPSSLDGVPVMPRLLTYDGAAHLLGLSTRQVQRLVSKGDLPIVRIGGAVRVEVAAVDALVTASKENLSC